jgi:hypothetical protein
VLPASHRVSLFAHDTTSPTPSPTARWHRKRTRFEGLSGDTNRRRYVPKEDRPGGTDSSSSPHRTAFGTSTSSNAPRDVHRASNIPIVVRNTPFNHDRASPIELFNTRRALRFHRFVIDLRLKTVHRAFVCTHLRMIEAPAAPPYLSRRVLKQPTFVKTNRFRD